jgi:hypothetical protein
MASKAKIYVLAPDEKSLEAARERYTDPIFCPILLPQTPYLESYMYTDYLMAHEHEWRDCEWVGCIAHSAHTKQPRIFQIQDMMNEAKKQGSQCCAFLYRGDPLLTTADTWHPGFTECWKRCWHAVGWNGPMHRSLITEEAHMVSFYCNYWCCTPHLMRTYCTMMRTLRDAIESDPELKEALYKDSTYKSRGRIIAKIPDSKCVALWGKPYYPMLPFVLERMPCLFFAAHCKITLLR